MTEEEHRLQRLLSLIEERIEPDYGYLPAFDVDDTEEVDFYVQEIQDALDELIERGVIDDEFLEDDDIMEALQDI